MSNTTSLGSPLARPWAGVARRAAATWCSVALATIAPLAGCNEVLGIEEARLDPAIEGGQGRQAGQAGADPVCTAYCQVTMQNCTGDLQQYPTLEICLAMCSVLDNGPANDLSGNTVECRANHAKLAVTDAENVAKHCNAASPIGGGTCGAPCESFCALNLAQCRAPRISVATYPSGADCTKACAALAFDPAQARSDFLLGEGNTLHCRDYHLQAAFKSDAAAVTHCDHTAIDSAVCVDKM